MIGKHTFIELVREAFRFSLENDSSVRIFGLGVPDPKGVFGSTTGLQEEFGVNRVFDIPLSENAITGFALGLAMCGLRPVMNHQRADFAFTSMEQITNQISKLRYTTQGRFSAPLVLRMIVGRGWGQGPTHAQSPHSLYSGIPGLKVVMPSTPQDAYWLTRQAIDDEEPVIIIEHRWLHQMVGAVDISQSYGSISKSEVLVKGEHLSLFSMSYGTLECLKVAKIFSLFGIGIRIVNLRTVSPLDTTGILESVRSTRNAAVLDVSHPNFGVASEISSIIHESLFETLEKNVLRLGNKYEPTPSAPFLAKNHYANVEQIALTLNNHFKFGLNSRELAEASESLSPKKSIYDDQPDIGNVGPF